MKALARTRAIGGSLVVTIPKDIVKEESLRKDELVEIEVGKVKRSGFGLIRGTRRFTKEDELDTEM